MVDLVRGVDESQRNVTWKADAQALAVVPVRAHFSAQNVPSAT
jgi:hypothetical protein